MKQYERFVSLVLLEHQDGKISLQLRDDFPHIGHPNHWGIFGGAVEDGEDGMTAALREIEEELAVQLNPAKFDLEPNKQHHFFHYPVEHEMASAKIQEGQRFGTFSPSIIQQGSIEGHLVVPSHLDIMNWYWENNR